MIQNRTYRNLVVIVVVVYHEQQYREIKEKVSRQARENWIQRNIILYGTAIDILVMITMELGDGV